MEVFLGSDIATPINFTPRDWAPCNGQLLAISQNSALFSLLGTTYGGDGQTTCGLPDLRGRMAIGAGNGPVLSPRVAGEMAGSESYVGQGAASADAIRLRTSFHSKEGGTPFAGDPQAGLMPVGAALAASYAQLEQLRLAAGKARRHAG